MCEFISQNYTSVSWRSPLTLCLRNLRRTSLDCIEDYADKGNIVSWKRERSFARNFLVMCEFISQSYNYVSCSSPISLCLRNLRRTSLDCIEDYVDKGNIISPNSERTFLSTSLWSVNSSHRVTALFSGSSLLTLFSWNLQSEIWEPIGVHGEKGNILR